MSVKYEIFLRCLGMVKTVLYAVTYSGRIEFLLCSSSWERRTTMMSWCAWSGWKVWHLCGAYEYFLVTTSAHLMLLKSLHKHSKCVIPFIYFMHVSSSLLFSSPNSNCTIKTQICQKMSLHPVLFLPYLNTSEKSHNLQVCRLWKFAVVVKISAKLELQKKEEK